MVAYVSPNESSGTGDLRVESCPIVESIKALGSEWNLIVIRYLLDKPMGFNEILRTIRGMNSKTLSRVLKTLQKIAVVDRKVLSTQPFSVEYSLTEKGRALEDVLRALQTWGEQWLLAEASPS